MQTGRLEAFTDGVVAIIITITVLELPVPHGASWPAIRAEIPILLAYVLSFVNVGLYWANHHHLLHATDHIDGRVLWANLVLLFWLSLAPWVIRWIDEVGFQALPVAAYGVVFGMAAIGYSLTLAGDHPGKRPGLNGGARDRAGSKGQGVARLICRGGADRPCRAAGRDRDLCRHRAAVAGAGPAHRARDSGAA